MRELDKDVALVGVDLLLKQVGEAARHAWAGAAHDAFSCGSGMGGSST